MPFHFGRVKQLLYPRRSATAKPMPRRQTHGFLKEARFGPGHTPPGAHNLIQASHTHFLRSRQQGVKQFHRLAGVSHGPMLLASRRGGQIQVCHQGVEGVFAGIRQHNRSQRDRI